MLSAILPIFIRNCQRTLDRGIFGHVHLKSFIMVKTGDTAPNFTLQDQDFETHSLSDFKGRTVLLYFYPKDSTPGCTVEACSFRDNLNELKKHGVEVLGVSPDSVGSHKKFVAKHGLNFPLLADTEKEVCKMFGVWTEKSLCGKKYMGVQRDSFLINGKGKIVKHYAKINPKDHVAEILNDIKNA